MMFLDRGLRQAVCVSAVLWGTLLGASTASAQENLSANKSPAQVFASDCSVCHKTPQTLSKAGGPLGLGLESFLREHYTASRETAAMMARYLQGVEAAPAAAEKASKRGAPGAKKGDSKAGAKKGDTKAGDALPGDNKPVPASDSKPAETKPVEAKPAEKPPEAPKPDAPKAVETPKSAE